MRKSYSTSEKKEWIQKFQTSGLTVKKFSEKYKVNFHSLSAWLHIQKRKPEFNFVPIVKVKEETQATKINNIEKLPSIESNISFKFNIKIRIPNFISLQWKSNLNRKLL